MPVFKVVWDPQFKQLGTGQFWADVTERAVRSFFGVFLPALGVAFTAPAADILHAPWLTALVAGAVPAGLSVLMSIGSVLRPGSDPESGSYLKRPDAAPQAS